MAALARPAPLAYGPAAMPAAPGTSRASAPCAPASSTPASHGTASLGLDEIAARGPFTVYQAAPGYAGDLAAEIGPDLLARRDPLLIARSAPRDLAWAQNTWLSPHAAPIASIGDAARRLKAVQRNWHCVPVGHFRRAALIAEKLPKVAARPLAFPEPAPAAPLGAWTLWDESALLFSPRCSSPFPDGAPRFAEDRETPPNRAYLKLWELLTILPERPEPGQLCLDLGGAPGGWAWVLQSLGARVYCIDKAPLEPRIARLPLVETCRGSAFGLEPETAGAVDWLFSDVICYPERLLGMLRRWLAHGECRRYCCTVKLQGETDDATRAALDALRAIPDSRLLHLSQNKHELTWVKLS